MTLRSQRTRPERRPRIRAGVEAEVGAGDGAVGLEDEGGEGEGVSKNHEGRLRAAFYSTDSGFCLGSQKVNLFLSDSMD